MISVGDSFMDLIPQIRGSLSSANPKDNECFVVLRLIWLDCKSYPWQQHHKYEPPSTSHWCKYLHVAPDKARSCKQLFAQIWLRFGKIVSHKCSKYFKLLHPIYHRQRPCPEAFNSAVLQLAACYFYFGPISTGLLHKTLTYPVYPVAGPGKQAARPK